MFCDKKSIDVNKFINILFTFHEGIGERFLIRLPFLLTEANWAILAS